MKRNINAIANDSNTNNNINPPLPSSSINATSSKSHFEMKVDNNTILSAKTEFLRRVSNSISYLVDKHGYSRSRASGLILGEIRKGDPLPSEDEIFSVMEKYHVGMNEASEVIVVSNALSKIRREQNLPPTKAIENLTSSLTTMKLLGKVESQNQASLDQDDVDSIHCSSVSVSSTSSSTSSSSDMMKRTSSPKSFLSAVVEKSNSNHTSDSNISLTSLSSESGTKRKSSPRKRSESKPKKKFSKRSTEDEDNAISKSSTKDNDEAELDVKVAHKVILQKNACDNTSIQKQDHNGLPPSSSLSSPSSQQPTISNTMMKTSSPREKRDLVETIVEDQPKAKRQRLDSI